MTCKACPATVVFATIVPLFFASACARAPEPLPPLPIPKRVERAYPVRVFTRAEVNEMRATRDLAGSGMAYGTGCYCMPPDLVRGEEPEVRNLSGPNDADVSLAPDDSSQCEGLDTTTNLERLGVYLCREWSLGPAIRGNKASETLR